MTDTPDSTRSEASGAGDEPGGAEMMTAEDRSPRTSVSGPQTAPGHGAFAPGMVARVGLAIGRALPKGRAGLRMAGAARPLALTGLKDGRSDVEALGLKLRLHPRDNLSEKRLFLTPQCFDPDELDAVRAVMAPGKVFFDIGANAGAYALVAAKAGGPGCRVIAVEPQAEMRRRMLFNARQNGLETLEVTGVALADYEGEDVMRMVAGNLGRTALTGPGEASGEAVRVTTLPRLMEEMRVTRIDAMKIDVEGGEFAILSTFFKQAPETAWPELLILERADLDGRDAPDASALAQSRGYKVHHTTRMNVILTR
ncbi:MAG: FkbM family methyltransferase [Oceanicaulis sp.]